MKQAVFVKLNQTKWKEYENALTSQKVSADVLSKIYVQITEDLAFANAQYPNTKLYTYLNRLSLDIHNRIYKNKPEEKGRFWRFWKEEVPFEVAKAAYPMLYSLLIFLVGIAIGVLSAANDMTFARLILGDGYVNMTLRNIENGTPMGVYGNAGELSMFFQITFNNIRVSFMAFAAGLLTSVGSGFILIFNGIMLGVFHQFFVEQGAFGENMLSIWLHGTIEILSIVIAGGAGIKMGNGLLFPKTYPRLHSFKKSAKSGLKIVIGLLPFFIIAGFIESFITRHTEWPLAIKLLIIIASLALMIYYFIILPYRIYKTNQKLNVRT